MFLDLTGQKFGYLTAKRLVPNPGVAGPSKVWECDCFCGSSTFVAAAYLKCGNTTSCGCRRKEVSSAKAKTHGLTESAEYRSWRHMKERCANPGDKKFYLYGGRGIKVCKRWAGSFENFIHDMGKKPTRFHSLDRINVDLGYAPSNCRWATPQTQSLNQRRTVRMNWKGEKRTILEISMMEDVDYKKLYSAVIKKTKPLHSSVQRIQKSGNRFSDKQRA